MTILTKKVQQLGQKKSKSSKLRRQTSQALKSAKSLRRKSTSGINSIQRKIDKIHSELDDTSIIIQQKLAQRDSIKRLKDGIEERLKQEKERKKQMDATNPKFILRTHLLTTALDKALKESDFSEIARLRILLENPFQDQTEVFEKHEIEFYAQETPEKFICRQTSCSA